MGWSWTHWWLLVIIGKNAFVATHGFVGSPQQSSTKIAVESSTRRWANAYDAWRSDAAPPPPQALDEDTVRACLELFVDSDYGAQMFGRHPRAADIGITGSIALASVEGPEVTLQLEGAFWHKRATVLGRAAMWLNACIPEIVEVRVNDTDELEDFEQIIDEWTGEVLAVKDKRSPDFNGDRETMEYQGIDPDARGPFPPGVGGSLTINPV